MQGSSVSQRVLNRCTATKCRSFDGACPSRGSNKGEGKQEDEESCALDRTQLDT